MGGRPTMVVSELSADAHAGPAGPAADAHGFRARFVALFEAEFPRLQRYLHRLSGEAHLSADLAQDAFVQLLRRGSLPDRPQAWLITVALNRFRNARSTTSRRRRLLTVTRGAAAHSDPAPSPADTAAGSALRQRVRATVDALNERDRNLLLLRAEGYSYRDIALALDLHEASVGTLLARARDAFRAAYSESHDAP